MFFMLSPHGRVIIVLFFALQLGILGIPFLSQQLYLVFVVLDGWFYCIENILVCRVIPRRIHRHQIVPSWGLRLSCEMFQMRGRSRFVV